MVKKYYVPKKGEELRMPYQIQEGKFYNLQEISVMTKINYSRLYECVKSGELKGVHYGNTWYVSETEYVRFFHEEIVKSNTKNELIS